MLHNKFTFKPKHYNSTRTSSMSNTAPQNQQIIDNAAGNIVINPQNDDGNPTQIAYKVDACITLQTPDEDQRENGLFHQGYVKLQKKVMI